MCYTDYAISSPVRKKIKSTKQSKEGCQYALASKEGVPDNIKCLGNDCRKNRPTRFEFVKPEMN